MRVINAHSVPSPQVEEPRDARDRKTGYEPLGHKGRWILPVLLISSMSIVGALASGYANTTIPLWILLGFSIIFSLKNWLYSATNWLHRTSKYEPIWKAYKLLLNLSTLSIVAVVIQSGGRLFSGGFGRSPLIGSVVFLGEVAFLVWVVGVVHSNRSRWPSMSLTVFWLVLIAAVLAFAGVEPVASYKGAIASKISAYWGQIRESNSNYLQRSRSAGATEERPAQAEIAEERLAQAEREREKQRGTLEQASLPKFEPIAPINPIVPARPPEASIAVSERLAFDMINAERRSAGLSSTVWDDRLYALSLAHTQEMAKRGQLFHTPEGAAYGENAWGGRGYYRYSGDELARAIVGGWMSSPLHRAWILHAPLRTSVISIVASLDGQYSSWTFWTGEAGAGPPLIQKAVSLWQAETGGRVEWLGWLYDVKGYPDNPAFLKQLGVQ